jgi:hypothetical protein
MNSFIYSRNNPVSFLDKSGKGPLEESMFEAFYQAMTDCMLGAGAGMSAGQMIKILESAIIEITKLTNKANLQAIIESMEAEDIAEGGDSTGEGADLAIEASSDEAAASGLGLAAKAVGEMYVEELQDMIEELGG